MSGRHGIGSGFFASAAQRASGLFAVWLVLTDGRLADIPAGIIAAGLATWASLHLLPPALRRPSLTALVRLKGRFLWSSLIAGVDVARRALDPRLPLKPGFVTYRTKLPPGPARDAFRALMCLQPGTLPMENGDGFLIHCLDLGMPVIEAFAAEEKLFARAIGIEVDNG